MRLQRDVNVAGIEPELARRLARACASGSSTEDVSYRIGVDAAEATELLETLEAAGFLERTMRASGSESWVEWVPTVSGGALSMASFLRPITRPKAEALLAGVLARARAYNDDPGKLIWIDRIVLFGSLLDPGAIDFGDIDLQVTLADRPTNDPTQARLEYARDSQRTFSSFIDRIFWAETEVRQLLRNRSRYINVHTEDVRTFTNRWRIVFERSA